MQFYHTILQVYICRHPGLELEKALAVPPERHLHSQFASQICMWSVESNAATPEREATA